MLKNCVTQLALLTPFFADALPVNLEEVKLCDFDAHAAFCRGMLERGIYLPPSQYEAWFLSAAHTERHIDRTIAAAREAFAELA